MQKLRNAKKNNGRNGLLRILFVIAAVAGLLPAAALAQESTAAQAFINAPHRIFPLFPKNSRLDAIDYFNSGLDRGVNTPMGGSFKVTSISDDAIGISVRGAGADVYNGGDYDFRLSVLTHGKDTLYVITDNYFLPAPDGNVKVYFQSWVEIPHSFTPPKFSDWFIKGKGVSRLDAELLVPFVTARYSFDAASGTLIVASTLEEFLPEEEYRKVKDCMRSHLTYVWNRKIQCFRLQ